MTPLQQSLFRERLRLIQPTDPLWQGIMALIDAARDQEASALARPAIGDEEAHRGRGRMGMCMDLRDMLETTMIEAHQVPSPEDEP